MKIAFKKLHLTKLLANSSKVIVNLNKIFQVYLGAIKNILYLNNTKHRKNVILNIFFCIEKNIKKNYNTRLISIYIDTL